MFKWLKKLVQMNTTLLLKPEWEVKKSKPKKKKNKATSIKTPSNPIPICLNIYYSY